MRVITGTARGRKLLTPEGQAIRPTSERVKEAVFSMIQFDIEGRCVLDLFAGSGQMGIEALSRGAKSAVFVDKDAKSAALIRENIKLCDFSSQASVSVSGAETFLAKSVDRFDIVFLDPPYNNGVPNKILPLISEHMNDGGVILCEHDAREETPDECGEFAKKKDYKYGRITVSLYRKKECE